MRSCTMHHALLSANTLTLVVVDFPVALVEELVTVTARSLRYRREVEHFGSIIDSSEVSSQRGGLQLASRDL